MRRVTGNGGFTLIELLIAVILFSIVSTAAYNLLFTQTRFFDTQDAATTTQQNTRIALKRVANDVLLVGRGVNALSLDNPDVILPNDSSVPANTFQAGAITLLSIPNGVARIPFAVTIPQKAKFIMVVNDAKGVARGLKPGALIIVHDTNLNNSQVLYVTAATLAGPNVKIDFPAADSLLAGYPKATSRMYTLNSLSYRINKTNPKRPFIERQQNTGPWQNMVPAIENMTFTYYDSSGTVIVPTTQALRKEIRKVKVQIDGRSAQPVDRKGTYVRISMSTEVTPRNMME